jgi:hypothetical protein
LQNSLKVKSRDNLFSFINLPNIVLTPLNRVVEILPHII